MLLLLTVCASLLSTSHHILLPTLAQFADHDLSRIYYMEFIDEDADSEEIMVHVAEMILEKVGLHSQKWVVLVGDGKTYEHL